MSDNANQGNTPPVWSIGALVRAVADALQAKFNPVAVRGEISGFSRAASGHCYFTLKDDSGQLRCAMFRRAAGLLNFQPQDGEMVEVRGRLDLYGPRGDLQIIAESMSRAGAGALFEQFLRLKARLEAEGLFDPARKKGLLVAPRAIGVVTSLKAAALADVVTALQRRVPHIPVVVANASVQGQNAAAEIVLALRGLIQLALVAQPDPVAKLRPAGWAHAQSLPIDVILLVRGGGSIDDLWAFNDENLARCIAQSPVPVICGVGHETDFTIADFVADLRAPTPSAAAELAAVPREQWLTRLDHAQQHVLSGVQRLLDRQQQRLDESGARILRPALMLSGLRAGLLAQMQRLAYVSGNVIKHRQQGMATFDSVIPASLQRGLSQKKHRLERLTLGFDGIDPRKVLRRGYAWLTDASGHAVTHVSNARPGQALVAVLSDGKLNLTVSGDGRQPTRTTAHGGQKVPATQSAAASKEPTRAQKSVQGTLL